MIITDELAAALREVYRENILKAHSNIIIKKALAKYEAAKAQERPVPSECIEIVRSLKRQKLDGPFDQSQDRRDIKVWNNACDTIIGFLTAKKAREYEALSEDELLAGLKAQETEKGFPVVKVPGHVVNHMEWRDHALIVTVGPRAQEPGDLVKRLRELRPYHVCLEAADRIEALEAAATYEGEK